MNMKQTFGRKCENIGKIFSRCIELLYKYFQAVKCIGVSLISPSPSGHTVASVKARYIVFQIDL